MERRMSKKNNAHVVPGFGARLRRRMARCGLSPESLAYLTCLSKTTISRALDQNLVTRRTEGRIRRALAEVQRDGGPRTELRAARRPTTFGPDA